MNNKEENKNQQQEELIPNSKEKERIEFLDYLRKAKNDRENKYSSNIRNSTKMD